MTVRQTGYKTNGLVTGLSIQICCDGITRNSSSSSEITPGSGSPPEYLPLYRPELWRERRPSPFSSLAPLLGSLSLLPILIELRV